MKKISLYIFLVSLSLNSFAQGGDQKKAVVKLNLLAFAFKTGSFQYEQVLTDKLSLVAGIRYSVPRGLPSYFTSNITEPDLKRSFETLKWGGYAVTPELRFYPGQKGAPRGFYLAPYFRYAKFNANMILSGTDTSSIPPTTYTFDPKGSVSIVSGGLMIGAQWIAKAGFTFDWWIAGFHYGLMNANFSITDPAVSNLSQANKNEILNNWNAENAGPFGNFNASIEGNTFSAKLKSGVPGFRAGLTFGWAF